MSSGTLAENGSRAKPPATVGVWDPFVRAFHWSLVTLVIVALATGDEVEWLHLMAGLSSS